MGLWKETRPTADEYVGNPGIFLGAFCVLGFGRTVSRRGGIAYIVLLNWAFGVAWGEAAE